MVTVDGGETHESEHYRGVAWVCRVGWVVRSKYPTLKPGKLFDNSTIKQYLPHDINHGHFTCCLMPV